MVRLLALEAVANPSWIADALDLVVLVADAFGVQIACAAAQIIMALFSVAFVGRSASAFVVADQVVADGVDVTVRLARLALVHI